MKIFLHIILLVNSTFIYCQEVNKIKILNADEIISDSDLHPDYWRLIGNIKFQNKETIMYCDSAHHYKKEDKIRAYGKIRIDGKNGLHINGKKLEYIAKKGLAIISGNVIMQDVDIELKTDKIDYNILKGIAIYNSKTEIIDKDKTLLSKKGIYYSQKKIFNFSDSVILIGDDYTIKTENMEYNTVNKISIFHGSTTIYSNNSLIYCESGHYNNISHISKFNKNASLKNKSYIISGDNIYYNKKLGYGKVIGNVSVIDTLENIKIYGDSAHQYQLENKMIVQGNPMLEIPFENDTLFIYADIFNANENNSQKIISAYHDVDFQKKNLEGKCDSLVYKVSDSLIFMFNNPVLWSDNLQISSDTMTFFVYMKRLKELRLKSNPMIIEKEDSLDFNQIKGKRITVNFKDNSIKNIDVKGNGQSIFLMKNNKETKKIGLNYTECVNMTLFFKENKFQNIVYKTAPFSKTIPYQDVVDENRYLKGFLWRINEKEKKPRFIQ